MTLVERFIEFQDWPTGRKTVWLMGLSFVFHVPVSLFVALVPASSGIADVGLLRAEMAAVILVVLACAFAGWVCDRRASEGRWTAYLVVVVYGGWIASLVLALGVWSTPLIAFVPSAVILVTLWYDETVGWWAFAYSMLLLMMGMGLYTLTDFPYAPGIVDRSLDAQNDVRWLLAMVAHFLGIYLSGFLLIMLVVRARAVQDTRLHRAHSLIRRYVPAQLAEKILRGEHDGDSPPQRARLTIFFSDLVGFTEIAEELEPEDLSRVLNEYFSEMTAIAHRYGGTVDELSGDAILIFFGAPVATSDKDHALRAVRMAVDMQQAIAKLNMKWRAAGITESLQVRMGINTGVVTVGNFGSPDRMKYAALGKHVNLAARLQAHCEPGKVLLSRATWLLINDQVRSAPKSEVQLKGIHKPVPIYEVVPS